MKISSVRKEDEETIKEIVVQCFSKYIEFAESEKEELIEHIFSNIEQNVGSLNSVFVSVQKSEHYPR